MSTGRVVGFSGAPGMWSYVVPGTGSVKGGTFSLKTIKRKWYNQYFSLFEDCFFKSNILQKQNKSKSLPIPWSSFAVSCVQKPFSISYSRPWKEDVHRNCKQVTIFIFIFQVCPVCKKRRCIVCTRKLHSLAGFAEWEVLHQNGHGIV